MEVKRIEQDLTGLGLWETAKGACGGTNRSRSKKVVMRRVKYGCKR